MNIIITNYKAKRPNYYLRLVFTSDGVGVVIRSAERFDLSSRENVSRKQNTDSAYDSVAYDPVKTALSESEAEAEE